MLRIAVCVKQVPFGQITMDDETGTLKRGEASGCMNMYDYVAIETAIQIRHRCECHIDVFTMGPRSSEKVIREALALGADHGILVSDAAFAGADVLATAYTLSCAILSHPPYDLILCGKQTTDGDTAQVSGTLAGCMSIPYVPWVEKIESCTEQGILVNAIMDGKSLKIHAKFPALMSVMPSIYPASMPTLVNMIKSKKMKIEVLDATAICGEINKMGKIGSATKVIKIEKQPIKERKMPRVFNAKDVIALIENNCQAIRL